MATGLFNLKQVNQAISQGAWSGYIAPKWVEYLVVAGGGGAGGAGGAGGGLLTGIVTVAAGTSYTVTVGSGGTGGPNESTSPATSGSNSVFGSISATGGGKGGTWYSSSQNAVALGATGGSGGGSAGQYTFSSYVAGAQGTAGQGNAGGSVIGATGVPYYQAGGGGAGTVGLNAKPDGYAGNGGAGIASSISGTVITYAGGGGGGRANGATDANTGKGGVGGGGDAGTTASSSGTAGGGNTGGGGGGSNGSATGSNGGSGIVVVRYPGNVQFFTGGTLSYANGYMIHTFYASGTLAPTTPTPYVTDYQISRSLRFYNVASDSLTRTPASASNRKTWTLSAWVKRSAITTASNSIFSADTNSTNTGYVGIYFGGTTDTLTFQVRESGVNKVNTTTQVFRDVSAWYHVVFALDTTQATSTDRLKIYVNGSQITSFSTADAITQNFECSVNNTVSSAFGYVRNSSGSDIAYYSGYMTEVNFIDGQALTPSSFGYTDPDTGVWSPLAFVGTYGTNGFYLNFSDNSNTTAATLGKDYSGNGNNWTPNNFSVTAGAGNDSLVDSPTSYGTDTGVGGTVRGNYSTMNPLDDGATGSTISDGNLKVVTATSGYRYMGNTIWTSAGKFYAEFKVTASSGYAQVGIATKTTSTNKILGQDSDSWSYDGWDGSYGNNSSFPAYGSSFGAGDTIGIAIDRDNNKLYFSKNGTWQNSSDPAAGTGSLNISGISGIPAMIAVCDNDNGGSCTFEANFGQRPFAYTAPSGFKALCTQNLPTPTIGATTATTADKYFGVNTYTGTGATQVITNSGFQPDWVWLKIRSGSSNHVLIDAVRGYDKYLASSSTAAESTSTDQFLSFNSNGFTLGSNAGAGGNTNQSGSTYVGWQWKANGSGVTNTAGSITSTVSANTTSGFSVVTYTGTGSAATIGHGLGVAPSMLIFKSRTNGSENWNVYHKSLGASTNILLNSTIAAFTDAAFLNATAPTSTVLSVGGAGSTGTNQGSNTYVCYAFAEVAGYSKFGSYTGNGSADGVFVYCGFRPAYVMIKLSSAAGDSWQVFDAARNTSNVMSLKLQPNLSNAESSLSAIDFVSNGFKLRDTNTAWNGSGSTYIFACFATAPFKYSLAR